MEKPDFVTYEKFFNRQEALDLADFLKERGIQTHLKSSMVHFDPSLANNELNREFELQLLASDFVDANTLRTEYAKSQLELLSSEHYLFTFTDKELIEILSKPDEWSPSDSVIAQHILASRGLELDSEDIDRLKTQRLEKLQEPEQSEYIWIVFGYIFALGGGIVGIIIGWHLWFHKKTLPNGKLVYHYVDSNRKHGLIIGILGSILLIVFLTILIHREATIYAR